MSPEPTSKSRLVGSGATLVMAVEPIVGTKTADPSRPDSSYPGAHHVLASPGGDELSAGSSAGAIRFITPETVANGTRTLPEYAPGVMYVRTRLLQMRDRSHYEVQPYPDESSIANAWSYAWNLVTPGCPTPSVVPSEDGNVSFVWHKGGWDIEVEVGWQDAEVWAEHAADSQSLRGSISETASQLRELLRGLR